MFDAPLASFNHTPFDVSGCDTSHASHSALEAKLRTGSSVLVFGGAIRQAFLFAPGR